MNKNIIEIMKRSSNSQNFTLIAREIIWYEYNLTISKIYRRIIHAKFYLLNRSFVCRPFYDTLVNVGKRHDANELKDNKINFHDRRKRENLQPSETSEKSTYSES
ncbi:unnamed protein product [Cercopithifilaria johnstoni]|uniref:Uncharacterized protein n=1 Tax=Cercopithifilaria johnstoni TaxID=2874296 RepID=A0A8J2QA02_9BILA|nr:unnamed protein product [Cercopithifilaria johnstoni]